MKLLFSEQKSDYDHYQFPYAIWELLKAGKSGRGERDFKAEGRKHGLETG